MGYSCSGIKQKDIEKKVNAFSQQRTTTHWPYPVKLFPKKPRFFSQEITLNPGLIPKMRMEDMSPIQRNLLGL